MYRIPQDYASKLEGDLDMLVAMLQGARRDLDRPEIRTAIIQIARGEIETTLEAMQAE